MNGKQVTGEVGASDLRDGGREDARFSVSMLPAEIDIGSILT